jgi:hypothetical protein
LKLRINRETLRVLGQPQLDAVVAGLVDSATVRYSNCGSCNTGIESVSCPEPSQQAL